MKRKASHLSIHKPHQGDSKRNKHTLVSIDQLPDDIFINIISRLTMREAVRTSVLSSRWENLWKYTTGSLVFDAPKVRYTKRDQFVRWVNQVTESHLAPTLEAFEVHFTEGGIYQHDIDTWIRFAIQKRSQRLVLRIRTLYEGDLPFHPQWHSLAPCASLSYLKTLHLGYLQVSGEDIRYILSHSPLLEELCVEQTPSLTNLTIDDPSLKLKSLEIVFCYQLQNVDVSAPQLMSFKFSGRDEVRVFVKNAPQLLELSLAGRSHQFLEPYNGYSNLLSYVSQLKILKVDYFMGSPHFLFPDLRRLEQLELILLVGGWKSLLPLILLIRACPLLRRFVAKVMFYFLCNYSFDMFIVGNNAKTKATCACSTS